MDIFHCSEYEYLTMEEKLLVDIEMRKWFRSQELKDLCAPISIFRLAESRIIEKIKEEDERRKARDANANASVAGRKRNRRTGQRNI